MTGPRSARSARLFVGSTPSMVVKVQSAGQTFQVVGEPSVPARAAALRAGVFEQLPQLGLDRRDLGVEPLAILVLLVSAPGGEHAAGELESLLAEGHLLAEPFGVAAEVAL
jgi:hypothetical protein